MEATDRQIKGYSIIAKGDMPTIADTGVYVVPSQSTNAKYKVSQGERWTCTCPDHIHRGVECKHICAVQFFLKVKHGVAMQDFDLTLSKEIMRQACRACDSVHIKKNGTRTNKSGEKQRYECLDCGKRFVLEPIKYIKGSAKMVCLIMDLYLKGLSLRDIKDTVKQFYDMDLSHEAIRQWVLKFTQLMNDYTAKFKPQIGNKWHADEQFIKTKREGEWEYCWNIMDSETKFLIANNVTKSRGVPEARAIFHKAHVIAGKRPQEIVTDGLQGYRAAFVKEFYKNTDTDANAPLHRRAASLRDKHNNNLIERYHGQFREFDKVRRGIDRTQEWNEAFKLFHNFIRKSYDDLTPAERANIDLQLGQNRWLDLLKKSLVAPAIDAQSKPATEHPTL